ncbi:ArsR family transcriptional regulator [Streptomyces incarnatus]|uniref:ArsR family transcriptional regulator n=1 Tax=Streptomyces incarnatus TaxID=665007 RepID=A0ABM5TX89_9ACTN|nr:helix-turn-helix domain-containing protein [Streptomyces incarnatus]AKJ15551.1 ArsR family transcriptional regulator [Streptomyces incarnatus]
MGLWQIDTDTLARSRFVLSPFAETFASLKLLHSGTGAHPGDDAWLRAHLPGYRARLAADPVTARLVPAALGRSWIADFFCPTSCAGESFEETVTRVRAAGAGEARANLRVSLRGPLPAVLERDDLPERAAALLTYVWEETVRPYWQRRRRILEADMVARTARVNQGGWAAVLDSLQPGTTQWLGDSRFRVNLNAYPPREVAAGAELLFMPVTARTGWVSWEGRERYAVVYPCLGTLAEDSDRRPVPAGLGALIGTARAGLLALLDTPLSTTQLVAVTGQALGSVGGHLRVLLDAGLVERRRAGRSVLYVRTAAGEVLMEASGAGAGDQEPERGDPLAGRRPRGRPA